MNAKEIIESKENKEELCKQHCRSAVFQINAVTYLFDDGTIKVKQRGKGCPIFFYITKEELL